MRVERLCLYCNQVLSKEWARSDRKYCDESCRSSFWYYKKYKTYYDNKYQKQKKAWEQSPNGKRAGIPIRQWIKLPKDWQ